MLRISRLADYGTVIMVYLARHNKTLHNAKEIAQQVQIALPTVSKLLKLLSMAGLLESLRGAKGGYQLAKEAGEISIAQIIIAVEGNAGLTACSDAEGECDLEHVCSIRDNWRLISQAVYSALDSVSLAALAQPNMPQEVVDVSRLREMVEEE